MGRDWVGLAAPPPPSPLPQGDGEIQTVYPFTPPMVRPAAM